MNLLKRRSADKPSANAHQRLSYSQCGEDLIADFVFAQLRIDKPSYLDLGAHHPQFLSNTYFFYNKGSRGTNVEPDRSLLREFLKIRPEDKNLNVGVGLNAKKEIADFYLMSARTLNTFSKEEATRIQEYGTHKIDNILKVELVPLNQIIKENFFERAPNFVSIDIEGLDFEIAKSFDFDNYRPEVFCIETLTYTEDNSEEKETEILDYMQEKNYIVYADTFINTIFVDRAAWQNR